LLTNLASELSSLIVPLTFQQLMEFAELGNHAVVFLFQLFSALGRFWRLSRSLAFFLRKPSPHDDTQEAGSSQEHLRC
jgi:hypothetical protein